MGDATYKVLAAVAAVGAGKLAHSLTETTWKFVSGGDSPENPADPDIEWKEAVAFAVLSGALVGVVRMLASREAAKAYKKSTGHLPKSLAK